MINEPNTPKPDKPEKPLLLDLLQAGAGQAVTAAELAQITGLTVREITRTVQALRGAGWFICSATNGYFTPETREERLKTIRSINRRIRNQRATAGALAAANAAIDGQEMLEGVLTPEEAGESPAGVYLPFALLQIDGLTMAERGQLLTALLPFAETGEEPELLPEALREIWPR